MVTNIAPTLLPKEASPYIKGCYLKHGEVVSDFGYVDFPIPSATQTNQLNGTVMLIDQFYKEDGTSSLLAFTTTNVYKYNTTTETWDVVTQGIEIDDCEAAWDAKANVTSTRDSAVKLRDTYSAKHVIAAGFTTGIVSSEDDLQNTDISAATNTHLSYWIRATAAVAAEVFSIRLDEQAACAAGATYADYYVPALVADEWQHVVVDISAPDDDDGGTYPDDLDALASVGLIANSDPGAVTIYIDDMRTVKAFTGDGDNKFSTTAMSNTFMVTNGIDQPQKYTGSGLFADLTTTLAAGAITTSEVILTAKDHVVLFNNTENGADAPLRATWSNIGRIEDYVGGTAGYQDLTDDESWVIAAEQLSENAWAIYKERSIVLMVWVGGATPFRFMTMVTGTGALSKDAIVDVGGEHMVLGPDVTFAYKGTGEIEILDDPVKRTMYDRLSREYAGRSFIIYVEEDDELQVWIPTIPTSSSSGSITEFADGGGGQVTVTSAAHGLSNDDRVIITETVNYNGEYTIAGVATNTFEITATWAVDDATGTWRVTQGYPNEVWCYDVVREVWYRKSRSMTGYGFYQAASSLTIGELTGNIGEQDWRFGDMLTKAYAPITLVGDNDGKVYQLSKTTLNNDGTAITNEFQTPDFVLPGTEDYMNYYMRVPQLIFEAKGQSVTTTWSGDGGNTWHATEGGGGNTSALTSDYKIYQQDFDTSVRKIRFKFLNNTASSGFYLRYYGFYWREKSGRL